MRTDCLRSVSGKRVLIAIAVLTRTTAFLVACFYVPIGTMPSWPPHYGVISALTIWTIPWSGVAEDLLGYELSLTRQILDSSCAAGRGC